MFWRRFVSKLPTVVARRAKVQRNRNIRKDSIGQHVIGLMTLIRWVCVRTARLDTIAHSKSFQFIPIRLFSGTKLYSASTVWATIRRDLDLEIAQSKCWLQATAPNDQTQRRILWRTVAIVRILRFWSTHTENSQGKLSYEIKKLLWDCTANSDRCMRLLFVFCEKLMWNCIYCINRAYCTKHPQIVHFALWLIAIFLWNFIMIAALLTTPSFTSQQISTSWIGQELKNKHNKNACPNQACICLILSIWRVCNVYGPAHTCIPIASKWNKESTLFSARESNHGRMFAICQSLSTACFVAMKWLMNWRNLASRRESKSKSFGKIERIYLVVISFDNIIMCTSKWLFHFSLWSMAKRAKSNRIPFRFQLTSRSRMLYQIWYYIARDGRKLSVRK